MYINLTMIEATLSSAVIASTPVLFACEGEILTERSGIMNIGLEGIMLMGAVTGFMFATIFANPWVGVIFACIVGALFSALHALLSVTLGLNQIASGFSIWFMGTGISSLLGTPFINVPPQGFEKISLGILSKIPLIGPVIFDRDPLVYIGYLVAPILWIILFRTRLGLNIRAVGQDAVTADSAGLKVELTRYACIMIGGALAGLGGAYMSLAYNNMWREFMTAGRGWVAFALVIFAGWDPWRAWMGALLFGAVDSVKYIFQLESIPVPVDMLNMFPYAFTLLVLVFAMWRAKRAGLQMTEAMGPRSLGTPFSREDKVS